jgi:hypothetical protein
VVRSLEEVKAKEGAWSGSMRELIEAAARNPENDLGVRLAAAALLLRHEQDTPPPRAKVDLSLLDAGERTTLLTLLERVLRKNLGLNATAGGVIGGERGRRMTDEPGATVLRPFRR